MPYELAVGGGRGFISSGSWGSLGGASSSSDKPFQILSSFPDSDKAVSGAGSFATRFGGGGFNLVPVRHYLVGGNWHGPEQLTLLRLPALKCSEFIALIIADQWVHSHGDSSGGRYGL